MIHRIPKSKFLLFCLLILSSTDPLKSIENKKPGDKETAGTVQVEEKEVVEISFTVTPIPDVISSRVTPTSSSLISPNDYLSTAPAVSSGKHYSNATGEFRPSVHLGVIEEPNVRANPSNDLRHVKYENSDVPETSREAFKIIPYSGTPLVESLLKNNRQNGYGNPGENIPAILKESEEEGKKTGRIKFQDEGHVESARKEYQDAQKDDQLPVPSILDNSRSNYDVIEQQQLFENLEKPVYEYETGLFVGKPTKFQEEGQKFDLSGSSNFGTSGSQYYGLQQGYSSYQPSVFQQYEAVKKPDDVVYVHQQESSFTRTRKYPFSYYQLPLGYREFEFADSLHSVTPYPRRRRISPWKKLIHLIGAFLPFGLLLASLTPNVIKIENTTQPNIVLSKLRVADLPVEHKQARLLEDSANVCEERSICEVIIAEGKGGPNALRNVLRNLLTRTGERTAKENGLESVFEAVKKKDCSGIVC